MSDNLKTAYIFVIVLDSVLKATTNTFELRLMKILIYILLALASGLLIFNIFHIDTDAPMEGDSFAAVIGVGASLCAIILLIILQIALKIQRKIKNQS